MSDKPIVGVTWKQDRIVNLYHVPHDYIREWKERAQAVQAKLQVINRDDYVILVVAFAYLQGWQRDDLIQTMDYHAKAWGWTA